MTAANLAIGTEKLIRLMVPKIPPYVERYYWMSLRAKAQAYLDELKAYPSKVVTH